MSGMDTAQAVILPSLGMPTFIVGIYLATGPPASVLAGGIMLLIGMAALALGIAKW